MIVANNILTTVFCDHDSDDCEAEVTLRDRLAIWKENHEDRVREAHEMFSEGDNMEHLLRLLNKDNHDHQDIRDLATITEEEMEKTTDIAEIMAETGMSYD